MCEDPRQACPNLEELETRYSQMQQKQDPVEAAVRKGANLLHVFESIDSEGEGRALLQVERKKWVIDDL